MAALSGCASLPEHPVRPESQTEVAGPLTDLGRIAANSVPSEELSGFRLLPLGSYALNTRVELARRATTSLDVMYYQLSDDETGRYLLRELRNAAQRGVRVRLLVDDLYTIGEDSLFLGLAATPNVEVRLFNPFPGGRDAGLIGRFAASPQDFARLDHRMHNKLFVADGVMAVAGGRNLADEYFMRSEIENFVDLDTFVVGAVVPQLSEVFDNYWNSPFVYPLKSITRSSMTEDQLRADFERRTGFPETPPPAPLPSTDTLGYGPIADDLEAGRVGLIWALAFAYADVPAKISEEHRFDMDTVQYNLIDLMKKARKEVWISSPYFIPGQAGMDMIEANRKRGVAIRVLTNSLASTDEPVVHTGYSRYRLPMLKDGVELYELSTSRIKTAKRLGMFGASVGRLHAKIAVIDRQTVFLGSMNFDPRSAHENTEMGLIIENEQLAKEVVRLLDIARYQSAYRLMLKPDTTDIHWAAIDNDQEVDLDSEPDATFWLRLQLDLLSPFAPEELL